ncbi:hypothetical protein GG344DRAFT_71533, partial [Lentinula edodes]
MPLLVCLYLASGNLYKGKRINDSMYPLRLLDGIFQSVRLIMGRMIVIDLSVGVMLPEMPLEELCASFLKCNNLWTLIQCLKNSTIALNKLRQFLHGVKVSIQIPGKSKTTAKRPIQNVTLNVGSATFDKNGVPTTVQ